METHCLSCWKSAWFRYIIACTSGLPGQAVLAVVWHDAALPARLANGQLRGALGTCGALHDLLAQLAIGRPLAQFARGWATSWGSTLWRGRGEPPPVRRQKTTTNEVPGAAAGAPTAARSGTESATRGRPGWPHAVSAAGNCHRPHVGPKSRGRRGQSHRGRWTCA